MKKLSFIIVILIAFKLTSLASDSLKFISPVEHPIVLSGNFMELRSNHFHSGIDIKSRRGVSGDKIMAVQNGFISRIRITSGSYGNALYIDHPNGITSVYAHLLNFSPEVEAFIKDMQYQFKSFELDMYLTPDKFIVTQGEQIGNMGNTGRSFGPHLHFELRETKTEKPINPEHYGLTTSDDIPPILQSLQIYTLSGEGEILNSESKYFNSKQKGYQLYKDKIEIDAQHVGFGVQMYDRMNLSQNKNGIYAYELLVDGKKRFSWKADGFTFNENKKINAFLDYGKWKQYSQKVYLLFKQACNSFSYYNEGDDGLIQLSDKDYNDIQINVYDIKGNVSEVIFSIKRSAKASSLKTKRILKCDSTLKRTIGIFDIELPAGSLFSPSALSISSSEQQIKNKSCPSIAIGKATTPVNNYYKISTAIPKGYRSKHTLVSKDNKGRLVHFGADTIDGRLVSYVDQLGEFYLFEDLKPPTVQVINLEADMKRPWKLKIDDNLIPDGRVDDLYFEAYANDQWMLFEYDLKNKLLIFDDFDKLPPKPFTFKMIVADYCGNTKQYLKEFAK